MPWIAVISIVLCISLIQTTLLAYISVLGIQPDLFIIFLVYVSLNSDLEGAFYANWMTGLAKDLFSEGPFGLSAIMFVVVGYLISMTKDNIFRNNVTTQILVTLAISIIYNLMYLFMLSISLASVSLLMLVWKCPMIAIYNSLIALPIFWLFKKFFSSLGTSSLIRK